MFEGKHPGFAQVLTLDGPSVPLTYALPAPWVDKIQAGMLVRVPLGRRETLGIVVEMVAANTSGFKAKYILACVHSDPVLTPDLLILMAWIQRYYAATTTSVIETVLPAAVRQPVREKSQTWLQFQGIPDEAAWLALSKRAPKRALFITYLQAQKEPVLKETAFQAVPLATDAYKVLLELGYFTATKEQLIRTTYDDALSQEEVNSVKAINALSEEQNTAVNSIRQSLLEGMFRVHLLHGVTGAGKTEVYIEAAKIVLAKGGSVLFLVPEVALTPQTINRLRARLSVSGIQAVVWHSHLSDGERLDAWMSMARGEARIVVGARSAVFSPLSNIKLIIVDEEHESAYKQDENPRYHGRDVAVYRAKILNAVCVLGSATPSLESLHNTQTKGYVLNRMHRRIDDRQLPAMHIVDMRREPIIHGGGGMISRFLLEKLQKRLDLKEQSILFLNRRGFAPRLLCKDCGHVVDCPHCSMKLTFHQQTKTIRCHWCFYEKPEIQHCPQCKKRSLHMQGAGTQRIEDILPKLLPGIRLARLDADLLDRKNAFRQILSDFRKGKIDVLIGTQMIAKGLDFPNVTLVGLIEADLSLHMPDFRAAERTFQLLVQVAGRAGRGDRAGEVVVQSFNPSAAPLQFARRADFDGFFSAELEERKQLQYPPYRQIIRHVFRARNLEKLTYLTEHWARFIEPHLQGAIELRGPAPAPREKVQDYYRYHLWYFTHNTGHALSLLLPLREQFKGDKDVIDVLDVNPIDLG